MAKDIALQADADGDGVVEEDEFLAAGGSKTEFDRLDLNKDGKVYLNKDGKVIEDFTPKPSGEANTSMSYADAAKKETDIEGKQDRKGAGSKVRERLHIARKRLDASKVRK